jgi:hypothetical protein
MLLADDPDSTTPSTSEPRPKEQDPAKVTARMLKIRELIEQGEYPDRHELAVRIVDTNLD